MDAGLMLGIDLLSVLSLQQRGWQSSVRAGRSRGFWKLARL